MEEVFLRNVFLVPEIRCYHPAPISFLKVLYFLDGGSTSQERFFGFSPPLSPRGVQPKKCPSGDHPEAKTFPMSYQRSPWVLPEPIFFFTNAELESDSRKMSFAKVTT